MKDSSDKKILLAVVFLSVWGLILRILKLHGREFWNDEDYQYRCMEGLFKPFWKHQQYGDMTSFPGEYLPHYHLIQWFGMNKWTLAIPHLLISILGFWVLYKLSKIYFKTAVGVIIAFLIFALNENLVFHALEFRPYGVLAIWSLVSLYLGHRIVDQKANIRVWQLWFIGITYFIIINYHIYGIAIFLGTFAYLFLSRWQEFGIRKSLPWKYLFMIAFISFPVWAFYASSNRFGLETGAGVAVIRNTFEYTTDPRVTPFTFFKIVIGNLVRSVPGYILLITAFFAYFLPLPSRLKQFLFGFILILFPIGAILYFDLRIQYWFLHRQFTWVMPFVAILIGWILEETYIYFKNSYKLKK